MRGLDDVVNALDYAESLLADREAGAVQDSLSRQHQMRRYEAVHEYFVDSSALMHRVTATDGLLTGTACPSVVALD